MQMSLSRLFWTVSSMFAIGLTLGVAPVHAQPPAKDVVVINTPAEPVPVTLQGTSSVTGNVAVTNTPT